MDDADILARIRQLVAAEHEARDHPGPDGEVQEIADLEGTLDQCWDLLRQRRARREFGQDADAAEVRSQGQVQHYLQ